jgi:hypothetical protein
MYVAITNHSTEVNDNDVATMAQAVAAQMKMHVAPSWDRVPPAVVFHGAGSPIPPGAHEIGVFDDADQAGDLGWHTEDAGEAIYGRVFARPVLQNGGDALTKPLSVASVLSHEVIEMFGDAACNNWADDDRGALHALELCDPVEADSYPVTVGTTAVTVSNFVLPSWFDPHAKPGDQFDWMKRTRRPFQLSRGGYEVYRQAGQERQRFSETYPEWKKNTKSTPLSRTRKRLGDRRTDAAA